MSSALRIHQAVVFRLIIRLEQNANQLNLVCTDLYAKVAQESQTRFGRMVEVNIQTPGCTQSTVSVHPSEECSKNSLTQFRTPLIIRTSISDIKGVS